jgi:hypothetical protein
MLEKKKIFLFSFRIVYRILKQHAKHLRIHVQIRREKLMNYKDNVRMRNFFDRHLQNFKRK